MVKSLGQITDFPAEGQKGGAPAPNTLLVIGTADGSMQSLLATGASKEGYQTLSFSHTEQIDADALEAASLLFIFVSDIPQQALLPQVAALIDKARDISVIPVVGYQDQEKAASLLELGCADFLLSPFSESQLRALLRRQEQVRAAEEGFVTSSPVGRRLLAMAQRVALADAPILITGETGTGKELMARYIHRFSSGEEAPFVAVNCAAIPEPMLESILFGHERGAFTGAVTAQPGKFELANGGTLLLDEIGELPLDLQAKLLRVLQEQRVERLGGHKEKELNVRVIAATNRDLRREVAEGRFREDLLFRIDVLSLHIAPLRDRREDVIPLAQRFIRQYAPQEAGHELLTESAKRAMLLHEWPGNVRELENAMQRALVLRNGLFIQPHDLGLPNPEPQAPAPEPLQEAAVEGKAALRARGKWAEYQYIIDAIRRFNGHKAKAAKSLGITPRALRYRLKAMREQGIDLNSDWLGESQQ
ncbi:AAA family ATPase [Alkalilimnicola ehrlichii]|uniref:AAA family ATPase n=1 Tax=Alkalilimnicola ehrlichii TaxID=351052 RepID=A0A3E0X1J1_9GAMM|nr:sigma-54 dependent transcriptional regulator [Alkalilimnicola ehrlichii]RFA30723.1 AAA family ATPase [Alkalilimnicola ehrlichii]RFA38299.1 AAA family ATPase [Alkalilimnicola ehrlichii]